MNIQRYRNKLNLILPSLVDFISIDLYNYR